MGEVEQINEAVMSEGRLNTRYCARCLQDLEEDFDEYGKRCWYCPFCELEFAPHV